MTCPFLDYRELDGGGDEPRAYCTAAGRFVQAMRADVCNDRYALDHAADCEIYLAHADNVEEADANGEATD